MRIVIEYLLPILLPTGLWVLWLTWQHRAHANDRQATEWQAIPWTWLLAAGVMLALLAAVGGTLMEGYRTGHYHPATVDEHGHLIPGGFN